MLQAKGEFVSLRTVSFIDNFQTVKILNEYLLPYGFSVLKIIIIILIFLVMYFIRNVLFDLIEKNISKIESLKRYSKDILQSIRKTFEIIIVLINIELTIYVYNNFTSVEKIGITFNILYAFFLTLTIYKIANTIANIKLKTISVKEKKIKNEVINVAIKMLNIFIWIIGSLVILYIAGVELTAVISGLGIGGLAVALASKDSLANFFGTLSILFSDVFSQGDWIKVDGIEGTVVEIGLRVTKLRTFDNAIIAIPNATVANKDVKNWNKRSLGRRIKMSLGIKYNTKASDIQNTITEIRSMLDKHPGIATKNTQYTHTGLNKKARAIHSYDDEEGVKKTLLVYLDEFSDSSINILIYCFSKSIQWEEWLEVKQDVMFKMMKILDKNNVEFAFPSMSLYHENES